MKFKYTGGADAITLRHRTFAQGEAVEGHRAAGVGIDRDTHWAVVAIERDRGDIDTLGEEFVVAGVGAGSRRAGRRAQAGGSASPPGSTSRPPGCRL